MIYNYALIYIEPLHRRWPAAHAVSKASTAPTMTLFLYFPKFLTGQLKCLPFNSTGRHQFQSKISCSYVNAFIDAKNSNWKEIIEKDLGLICGKCDVTHSRSDISLYQYACIKSYATCACTHVCSMQSIIFLLDSHFLSLVPHAGADSSFVSGCMGTLPAHHPFPSLPFPFP